MIAMVNRLHFLCRLHPNKFNKTGPWCPKPRPLGICFTTVMLSSLRLCTRRKATDAGSASGIKIETLYSTGNGRYYLVVTLTNFEEDLICLT